MKIGDILVKDSMLLDLRGRKKRVVLSEMAKALAGSTSGLDKKRVFEVLNEREKLMSTGIRDGVAIPHGEFPDLSAEIRSERCNHCGHPPCVHACPTGASHVNEGGTVLVTHDKCTGCKACVAACPYDSRFVHPEGYVDKCTFCLHRVQNGELPACVEVCPTSCRVFGDLEDPGSSVSELVRSERSFQLLPERGTAPKVHYLLTNKAVLTQEGAGRR